MAKRSGSTDPYRQMLARQKAQEQAQRQAARAAEVKRKEEEKAAEQAKVNEAASMTTAVEARINELSTILNRSLTSAVPQIDFDRMKRTVTAAPLNLGDDADPVPRPSWEAYAPNRPGTFGRIFRGDQYYEQREARARQAFGMACERAETAERERLARVAEARSKHARKLGAKTAEAERHNANIELFRSGVANSDRHAVSRYFQMLIDKIEQPAGFPSKRIAGYVPESTLLALEWYLPPPEVIPDKKSYRWVKARKEFDSTARPLPEVRRRYQELVAQVALGALHAVFSAEPKFLVGTVVFNGIVEAVGPVTGREIEPCLITLRATREQFSPLNLLKVDPLACIRRHFFAEVSRHPDELQAIPPVMEFKMADPRIIEPVDIISDLDKRPNLMELTAKEFEYFVHNLFDKMGFDTKLFKADGDGGVDCVAYDPTPIRGGKYVIQAKLYHKTVPPTAVRDLYGTMQHEGAQSGILITTSGYGPTSYEFASGKPLQLIDGSGLLALCKEHNIPARIVPVKKK